MPFRVSEDELLRSYLVGILPDEERAGIELRLLAEDSLFEAAAALEGDLLADYAADELSPPEAQVVRRWLAVSADVRQRFELIQALDKSAEQPSSEDRRQAAVLWERIAALSPEQWPFSIVSNSAGRRSVLSRGRCWRSFGRRVSTARPWPR